MLPPEKVKNHTQFFGWLEIDSLGFISVFGQPTVILLPITTAGHGPGTLVEQLNIGLPRNMGGTSHIDTGFGGEKAHNNYSWN